MAKTAAQRRDDAPPPRVVVITDERDPDGPAGRRLLPSPLELEELIRRIPRGRVLRLAEARATLAIKFRADYACAKSVHSALLLVAEAAREERGRAGPPTPYWRVVNDDGSLVRALPDGEAHLAAKLEEDGVALFRLGRGVVVAHLEGCAWRPPPPRRRGAPTDGVASAKPKGGPGAPNRRR
ncbi:MAG: hypothetical protein R3B48_13740 [Kofleriaceae bacterium]